MGRKYIDFWVKVSWESADEVLAKLRELGFSAAAVELEDAETFEELKKLGREHGLELYRKLVLNPRERRELLDTLGASRGRYEVISVICWNLEVALVAARDSRVDTLIIPPGRRYRIDKGVAALLKNKVELPFRWFLEEGGRRDFLETAMEVVKTLAPKSGIIVSSAASTSLELRGPMELAALLEVLGMKGEEALNAVSKTPSEIIETNLLKLSPNYVARGVIRVG